MIQHVNVSNEYINETQKKNHGIKILNQYKSINTINVSKSQTNISMKHRKKHGIRILNQYKSIIIISMSMSQMNTISKHASNDIKNSQCAIKKQVSTDRLIKRHVCFTLSSSLTLYQSPVESPFCGPRILAQCVSHSNGELNFYLKN